MSHAAPAAPTNGKGYPLGLEDLNISRETRIITTADIFDAMTSDRPYRAAMSVAQALIEMDKMEGTAIDPDCLAALKTIL